jgi:hypothetical protein
MFAMRDVRDVKSVLAGSGLRLFAWRDAVKVKRATKKRATRIDLSRPTMAWKTGARPILLRTRATADT